MTMPLRPPRAVDLVKRTRTRRQRWNLDPEEIANRVCELADRDREAHRDAADWRRQRYAKYRQWQAPAPEFPWPDSSNATLPDLTMRSLNVQDTLHNAVMSTRATVTCQLGKDQPREKGELLDDLLDYQAFEEQPGESQLGDLLEYFVNEGVFTVHVAWIREDREITDIRIKPPLRVDDPTLPWEIFQGHLKAEWAGAQFRKLDPEGWDWEVTPEEGEKFEVHFYTTEREDKRVEMQIDRTVRVYDGPRWFVLGLDDVHTPARVANLQPPSATNPNGAPHVILEDRPTIDQIRREIKRGFYDFVREEDKEALGLVSPAQDLEVDDSERQKDTIQGERPDEGNKPEERGQDRTRRYLYFGAWDVDGDGLDEQVMFWVLEHPKTLLRARLMTEMYPTDDGRRPFAEASFIPVPGRREGFGLLELMERLMDLKKENIDQGMNAATIAITPFGFYRPQSNLKNEPIQLYAGSLYPLNNPQQDVHFPTIQNQASPWTLNLSTMIDQWAGRLSAIDELQFGRVPAGKASALRTRAGMEQVLQKGEARPERILRRLFIGLVLVWSMMHQLNRRFLSADKKFSLMGYQRGQQDPYREVPLDTIQHEAKWRFKANIHTASREALRESLQQALSVVISPLMIQLGIATPEKVYNMIADLLKSYGLDSDRYIEEPTPGAGGPTVNIFEALYQISTGLLPEGAPEEPGGYVEHLEKLDEFRQHELFPLLGTRGAQLFETYYAEVAKKAAEQRRQEQLLAAAKQFANEQGGGNGTGGPPGGPQDAGGSPPVSGGGELLDETLPGAGGGTIQ